MYIRLNRYLAGGTLEMLKSFRYDIQDGHHGCYVEILQMISPLEF